MAYDENLAARVRSLLQAGNLDFDEKKMFGGLAFLLHGNMFAGVNQGVMMARVGPAAWAEALQQAGAREMDFTGKSLRGYVWVDAKVLHSDEALQSWLQRCLRFVSSLPAKPLR
ncbi:TfoX/Sxy family protein [Massilia sp. W12]|uniref:TfoX/Sxy family protein n=1 Tax=Massilia sp. W12 TaxID=3126507 RepID=UPI0030D20E01